MTLVAVRARSNIAGLTALGLAAVVGVIAAALSVDMAALIVAGVAATIAVLRRPEIGAALSLGVPILFGWDKLTTLDLRALGGGITITDALLLLTIGAWSLDAMRARRPVRLPSHSTTCAIVAFLAVIAFNVILVRGADVTLRVALNEVRPFLALLLVFPMVDRVRPVASVHSWLVGLVLLSVVPSTVTLYHYLLGNGSEATYSGGAIRIFGTFMYPAVSLVLVPCLIRNEPSGRLRVMLLASAVLAFAAIFFSFQRGAWLATTVGLTVVLISSNRRYRRRAAVGILAAAGLGVVLVVGVNALSPVGVASPLESGLSRLESAFDSDDVSRQHREAELHYALNEFSDHPLVGVGFGASTRFYSPMYNERTQLMGGTYENVYVHSSYSQLLMKAGLLGTAAYLSLVAIIAIGLAHLRRRSHGVPAGVAQGAFAVLVVLVVLAQSGPHLTSGDSVLLVAVAAWCYESVRSASNAARWP
jgi:O-antigen ligase